MTDHKGHQSGERTCINDTLGSTSCGTNLFKLYFNIIYDLLLHRCTATLYLFITKNYDQTKPKYVSQTLKEHGSKNSAGRCSCKLALSLPEVINM